MQVCNHIHSTPKKEQASDLRETAVLLSSFSDGCFGRRFLIWMDAIEGRPSTVWVVFCWVGVSVHFEKRREEREIGKSIVITKLLLNQSVNLHTTCICRLLNADNHLQKARVHCPHLYQRLLVITSKVQGPRQTNRYKFPITSIFHSATACTGSE